MMTAAAPILTPPPVVSPLLEAGLAAGEDCRNGLPHDGKVGSVAGAICHTRAASGANGPGLAAGSRSAALSATHWADPLRCGESAGPAGCRNCRCSEPRVRLAAADPNAGRHQRAAHWTMTRYCDSAVGHAGLHARTGRIGFGRTDRLTAWTGDRDEWDHCQSTCRSQGGLGQAS
jgi:hypothetical protein